MAGDKYLKQTNGTITEQRAAQTSAGAADANKIPALDAGGHLDPSLLPTGVGADTAVINASEDLPTGAFVNVYNAAGTAKARKADASSSGKRAHGYVLAAVTSGQDATVYFIGRNNQVSGQTPGDVFLSDTTPGAAVTTPPTNGGSIVQKLGVAVATTEINVEIGNPILLVA